MKRLWACYAPYQNILFFVIAGSVLTAGLEISFPMIVRYILEDILPVGDMVRLVHTAAVFVYSLRRLSVLVLLRVVLWPQYGHAYRKTTCGAACFLISSP